MESQLTVQETRQSPMAIDGQTTAFYSNALSMNQSVYAYSKNNDFSDKWTKLQNKMASMGASVGLAGGIASGAGSGAAEGAKIGGPIGAGIGTVVGAISGLAGGLTNYYMTKLENENRTEQLAMNQNIAQSQNAYQNLSLAQATNKTMSIPVSIAPLNVKNTTLIGDKSVPLRNTYREPDITRETALLRWQHLGYPFGMKAHFTDYDNRVNYNVVTVDWLNKEHYIKESIFTWLEDNLVQKSLFLFADETCLTLLAKLTGFYRLWHVVPSIDSGVIDAQIRAGNIEHTVVNKIANGDLNADGLPNLRKWYVDYLPWWKKPYSDMYVDSLTYIEKSGDEYIYYGIGDNAFSTVDHIGTAVWKPDGDVAFNSIQFKLLWDKKFPLLINDGTEMVTMMWSLSSWSVNEDDGTLTIQVGITLSGDPSPSSTTTPTDVYGQLLALAAAEISWNDSLGNNHSKLFVLRCIPEHITVKDLRWISSGDVVSRIDFIKVPQNIDPKTAAVHYYDVNFNIIPEESEDQVLACQIHTQTYRTTYHAGSHGSLWSTAAQKNHMLYSWYDQFRVHGDWQRWSNFLSTDFDGDNHKDNYFVETDTQVINLMNKYGYHADFPYCKFEFSEIFHNPLQRDHWFAELSSLTFGTWTTVPTSSVSGVFVPANAVADVMNDVNGDRITLNGDNIPCTVIETE